MVSTLRELGAECDWLIPDRIADGYGLSAANVERLAERGTSLLVTVDCGITAVEEVAPGRRAGDGGDRHRPPPARRASCPTARSCTRPSATTRSPSCAGRRSPGSWPARCARRPGAIGSRRGGPRPGGAGDGRRRGAAGRREPLAGEARAGGGAAGAPPGDAGAAQPPRAASRLASTRATSPSASAPRINAAGRLYRADAGVELFLTEDEARAEEIAAELNRANGERRSDRARGRRAPPRRRAASFPRRCGKRRASCSPGEGWHPGRDRDRRLAPRRAPPPSRGRRSRSTARAEGAARGAASPASTCSAALEACSEHLVRFGGHRAAAGLELRAENLDGVPRGVRRPRGRGARARGPAARPSGSTRWSAAPASASTSPRSSGELAPFGMGNPGRAAARPLGQGPRRADDGGGRQALALQPPQRLPPGARRRLRPLEPRGRATTTRSTPRCGSRSTTGTARSSRGSCCASSTRTRPPRTAPAPRARGRGVVEALRGRAGRRPLRGAPPEVDRPAPPRRSGARSAAPTRPRRRSVELLSSGPSVLAAGRATLRAVPRWRATAWRSPTTRSWSGDPGLPRGFAHVVLVDPPPSARLRAPRLPARRGGRLPAPGLGRCRAPLRARGPRVAPRPAR